MYQPRQAFLFLKQVIGNNMKLVKFKNGTYGVRKGFWPFYAFYDFTNTGFWWNNDSKFWHDCQTTDEQRARDFVKDHNDYGEVIK